MGFISTGLKIGAILTAVIAVLIGVFFGTTIPKDMGFYNWLKKIQPQLIGFSPAFLYGEEWNFTFDDLAQNRALVKGQRALITGANSGIGYATAEHLHKLGVEVIMACRNPSKCQKAAEDIIKDNNSGSGATLIKTMTVDTGSLASVQNFAKEYLSEFEADQEPLDMLFLNAGFSYANKDPFKCVPESVDGIESVFATNYLGHHLLYRLVEPSIQRSKMGRVVSTTSVASYRTYMPYGVATDLATLNGCPGAQEKNNHLYSYGQSKLAQIVWSKYVTRRNGPTSNLYVNAYHPGAVKTEIWGKGFGMAEAAQPVMDFVDWLQSNAMWTRDEGALTGLYLGTALTDLQQKDIRGKYYHPQSIEMENELANNITLQDQLWEFSEELVKEYLVLDEDTTSSNPNDEDDQNVEHVENVEEQDQNIENVEEQGTTVSEEANPNEEEEEEEEDSESEESIQPPDAVLEE